ncbi:MAG TPA: isochorismatase family cysteine hydrolase [bacterium]|nr:isochorismatase family cysteine hydrolase [bacterium]
MIEIPEPPVESRVDVAPAATALVIVDMQNDFVDAAGSLCVAGAAETVPPIVRLRDLARARRMLVVYTQDWHAEDDPEFAIWGRHAVAGTWGADIVPALAPGPRDLVMRKLRYDAFYDTPLEHELRRRGIDTLIITGTVSNICVLHTAGSAVLRWFRVIVPVDAVSALTAFDQRAAFRQIAFLYRGTLVPSAGVAVKAA